MLLEYRRFWEKPDEGSGNRHAYSGHCNPLADGGAELQLLFRVTADEVLIRQDQRLSPG
jgi:hypothetical protein